MRKKCRKRERENYSVNSCDIGSGQKSVCQFRYVNIIFGLSADRQLLIRDDSS